MLDHFDSHGLKHKAFNLAHGLYSGEFVAETIHRLSGRGVTIDSPEIMGERGSDYDKVRRTNARRDSR